jgi:signal recognition particle subunit SEC65
VKSPQLDEIAEAARMLNLDCTIEDTKAHPAAWWAKQGRVLVKKTDAPKSSILSEVCSKMKELRSAN